MMRNEREIDPMNDLDGYLPLTSVAFEILLALADRRRHGYAIMKEVERRTAGRVTIHPGTLYRAVSRLMQLDLVAELEADPTAGVDQRRRNYTITELGRRVAAHEAQRLEDQVAAARAQRLLEPEKTR